MKQLSRRKQKQIALPSEYMPGRPVPAVRSKYDKEAHLVVPLNTLAPGRHFRVTNHPDRPSWEGVLLYATFGSARIKRLGPVAEGQARTTFEFLNVATNSPVIPLDKVSPQYVTELQPES